MATIMDRQGINEIHSGDETIDLDIDFPDSNNEIPDTFPVICPFCAGKLNINQPNRKPFNRVKGWKMNTSTGIIRQRWYRHLRDCMPTIVGRTTSIIADILRDITLVKLGCNFDLSE